MSRFEKGPPALNPEKERYRQELDIMSDVVVDLLKTVETNPEASKEELDKYLSSDRVRSLSKEELARLETTVTDFIERRDAVKQYYDSGQGNAQELFKKVFGITPEDQVRLEWSPWSLTFCTSVKDLRTIEDDKDILGVCYHAESDKVKDKGLQGKVTIVTYDEMDGSYFGPQKRVDKSEPGFRADIKHENSHSFWRFVKDSRRESVSHRLDKGDESDVDPLVWDALNATLGDFLAGYPHSINLAHNYGPHAFEGELRKGKSSDLDVEEAVSRYRRLFVRTIEVIHEAEKALPKEKFLALIYILPPDRLERLMYFLNLNPDDWVKKWDKENDEDAVEKKVYDMLRRERSASPFGGGFI